MSDRIIYHLAIAVMGLILVLSLLRQGRRCPVVDCKLSGGNIARPPASTVPAQSPVPAERVFPIPLE